MKKYNMLLKKISLYLAFIIPFYLIFVLILPNLNRFGFDAIKMKDYTKTSEVHDRFRSEIVALENAIDWRIRELGRLSEIISSLENYFSIDTNIKIFLDVEFQDGTSTRFSNTRSESFEEFIIKFSETKIYYTCALNEWPDTNLEFLKDYRFHANQGAFKKLDVYVKLDDFETNDYLSFYRYI